MLLGYIYLGLYSGFATKDYFQQEDKLGNWIDECCIKKKGEFTTTSELFNNWINWCEKNNEFKGTNNSFAKKLVERGSTHSSSRRSILILHHLLKSGYSYIC